jgi:VanZ family protein
MLLIFSVADLKGRYWITITISFVFAIFAETYQLFVPGRAFGFKDLAANFGGICFAVLIFYFAETKLKKKSRKK